MSMYSYVKHFLDFFCSLVLILLLSPVILLLTVVLGVANGGAPFFTQVRPGRRECLFTVIKFRTMNNKRDGGGNLLPDAERLTPIGRFVRKTSLDELPQLFNVLKGDMSFVGPRPLLVEYLPLYNGRQKNRHHVRPGITGWAQVNGRNAIAWKDKFEFDAWYVENQSLKLDIIILVRTIIKVLQAEGINAQNQATMEKFTGN